MWFRHGKDKDGGIYIDIERVDEDRAMEFMKRLKDAVKSGEVESVTIFNGKDKSYKTGL